MLINEKKTYKTAIWAGNDFFSLPFFNDFTDDF
jgi:hypothetical protein